MMGWAASSQAEQRWVEGLGNLRNVIRARPWRCGRGYAILGAIITFDGSTYINELGVDAALIGSRTSRTTCSGPPRPYRWIVTTAAAVHDAPMTTRHVARSGGKVADRGHDRVVVG